MRIVQEDTVLGTSRVVWRFASSESSDIEGEAAQKAPGTSCEAEMDFIGEMTDAPEPDAMPGEVGQDEHTGNHDKEEQLLHEQAAADDGQDAIRLSSEHVSDLRRQIAFLQQQIDSQNQQLRTKDELIRNFQVLMKAQQDQVLRLETKAGVQMNEQPSSPNGDSGSGLSGFLKNLFKSKGLSR